MTDNILSDPWRIRCPECGSSAIKLNVQQKPEGMTRDESVSYRDVSSDVEAFKKPDRCYCKSCYNSFDKPVDAKTGERVTV